MSRLLRKKKALPLEFSVLVGASGKAEPFRTSGGTAVSSGRAVWQRSRMAASPASVDGLSFLLFEFERAENAGQVAFFTDLLDAVNVGARGGRQHHQSCTLTISITSEQNGTTPYLDRLICAGGGVARKSQLVAFVLADLGLTFRDFLIFGEV